MKNLKYIILMILSVFIIISCGDETTISEIDDTDPEIIEVLPLPSQNGVTINSAGNLVKSDSYKFQFVVGMNKTVNPKETIETKKYSFKFTNGNNAINQNNKAKYSFTLIK